MILGLIGILLLCILFPGVVLTLPQLLMP